MVVRYCSLAISRLAATYVYIGICVCVFVYVRFILVGIYTPFIRPFREQRHLCPEALCLKENISHQM